MRRSNPGRHARRLSRGPGLLRLRLAMTRKHRNDGPYEPPSLSAPRGLERLLFRRVHPPQVEVEALADRRVDIQAAA